MSTANGRKPKRNGIAFDDDIPSDGPELYMLRMKGNKCLTFTIYGTKVRGCWYHWHKDHSEPHFQDDEQCPGCKARQAKKWKGFLHVYCSESRQEVFLEVTRACAASLMQQLGGASSIRGAVVQIKRTGADNGRLYVTVLTPVKTPEILPAEKDPRPSILKLWGLDQADIEKWLNPITDPDSHHDFQ